MSFYFIADININDKKEYQKYIDKAGEIFKKHKGKYLAVDNYPEVLEGDRHHSGVVIIEFESKEDFEDWYQSKEYQKILKHRLKAAVCNSILVSGL